MTTDDEIPTLHLHFEGEAARGHTIPASALVQAAQALQRAIHLLAFAHEGRDLKERLRIGNELDRKYAVIFQVPENGGYDLPYVIGNTARTLLEPTDLDMVTKQHVASLGAVAAGDVLALKRIIPQGAIRRQYLTALKNMQPPKRTGLVVSIEDARRAKLLDGRTVSEKLAPLLAEPVAPTVMPRVVTGRLDALDFQARKLTLALFSGRRLDCAYGEDFEPALVENRRELIQVLGEAVLNDDDTLKALNNVTEILEIDESPLMIEEFRTATGETLKARAPLSLEVFFDQQDGLYTAEGDFHLMVTGETRAELEDSVATALSFLWSEYVLASPANFTEDGKDLRERLKFAFGGS
jgi:hypothetical protein